MPHDDEYELVYEAEQWPRTKRVKELKDDATKVAKKLRKAGKVLNPVVSELRTLAKTFWGQAWCRNLQNYQDYESRLPRGRSYLRNGAVIDLQISRGQVTSLVSGQEVYEITVKIDSLEKSRTSRLTKSCASQVGSTLELLNGQLSGHVMELLTDPREGLFPHADEIKFSCTCPDWAEMCKHVAATLYGVGVRLDDNPELLFLLRGLNYEDFAASSRKRLKKKTAAKSKELDAEELQELFGIEINLD